MVMFQCVAQGDAVAPCHGAYHSFPSLAKDPRSGQVVLLYRKALYDENDSRPMMRAHGLDGSLYTAVFNPSRGMFEDFSCLVPASRYPHGLMDGVISVMGDQVFLFERTVRHRPLVFVSTGPSLADLGPPRPFGAIGYFPFGGVQWGKMVAVEGGERLLQVCYGNPLGKPPVTIAEGQVRSQTRAALMHSRDRGNTWAFCSWISPAPMGPGLWANETAVIAIGETLYAAMRTGWTYPGPLYLSVSRDGGYTWLEPEPTGLYGEAPMWYMLPGGRVILGFRGFLPNTPERGGTFSLVEFDNERERFLTPFVVETYEGDHYDGGYGDMIWLESLGMLLVVYYHSDRPTPRNPWIRYALVSVV